MSSILEVGNSAFLDNIKNGGTIFLIGILTVFAVLGIIWCCLMFFKYFFCDLKRTKKVFDEKVVIEESLQSSTQYSNDEEIIAVIAAAIAMAESEYAGARFKVVSFRRK